MIYLIQSGNLYKIGYTTNLEHRFDQYKQHNPTAILLDSKEGSRKDESNLHKLCEEYRIDRQNGLIQIKLLQSLKIISQSKKIKKKKIKQKNKQKKM
jgi:hypothetical protein